MCRNIKTLHHFVPPATQEEVRASALQYVRKLSGMARPSQKNQAVFDSAVEEITRITLHLFEHLESHGPPRSREVERQKAVERGKKRDEQMRARVLRTLT
jgi:hypothetical protein